MTTFIFKGDVDAVGGMVKSKVNMVYENNDQEQYFQLNVTVDAKMDGGTEELTKSSRLLTPLSRDIVKTLEITQVTSPALSRIATTPRPETTIIR